MNNAKLVHYFYNIYNLILTFKKREIKEIKK